MSKKFKVGIDLKCNIKNDCDLTERQIVTTVADVIVESIENSADATDIDVQTTSEVM